MRIMKRGLGLIAPIPDFLRNAAKGKRGVAALSKSLSISVLNQAVSSATNFAMGLYLVRALAPAEFGVYGIGLAISMFYSGIGNALFLTQMVVHTPDKALDDRLPYAARILAALMSFCLVTVLCVLLVFVVGGSWSVHLAQYSALGLPVAAASVVYLFKDFFVRHSYTARKEIWALQVNIAVAVTLTVLLLLQYFALNKFTSERALWFYALSNMVGAVAGFLLARLPLQSVQWSRIVEDAREAWHGGRWAIGGVSITWAQSQAYTYVTAIFLGPAGVGYANAARMLITPFSMLAPAIGQVTMPRLAELRQQSMPKMLKVGFLITSALLLAATVYVTIIILAANLIVPLLLGNKYQNIRPLIVAWSAVLLLVLLRDGASMLLQILKRFQILMLTNILSAVAAVVSAVWLMEMYGVPGAIFGTGVGEVLLALMLWRLIWNESKNVD